VQNVVIMELSGKQFPKHVIIMAVRWYLAFKLSQHWRADQGVEYRIRSLLSSTLGSWIWIMATI